MLNELYELSNSLKRHGLLQSITHPDIGNVGKGYCLLFELNDKGIPCDIRILNKEQTSALWKHSKGNHNSFPAIRVQKPILSVNESKKIDDTEWDKAKLSEKIKLLSNLDYSSINPECNDVKISEWTLTKLKPVFNSNQSELVALKQLISVFPREGGKVDFLKNLTELLKNKIEQCGHEDLIDLIKKLLVGTYEPKTQKYVASCMTYYDMYETKYENLVSSCQTQQALVQLLNSSNTSVNSGDQTSIVTSPFSGTATIGIGDKYPNPNIPLLGLTYLYSKKSDTPCLTRYGMTGTKAFQAGVSEIHDISNAIAFLTADSRKNKSWCAMSDSNRDKPNLLLAYLPDDPQNNAFLAKILGDPSEYDNLEEYLGKAENVYTELCRQVIGNLEDVLHKNSNTKVNLILLETLDAGRKQVVYESSFTAERLCENLRTWDEAAKNTPPIEIRIYDKSKKEINTLKPICPGPSQICKLFKINYTRSGLGKPMQQSDISLHDIYAVYMPNLQTNRSQVVERFFQLAVKKSRWLLGDTAYQMIVDYTVNKSQTQVFNAAMFVSLLSILLYLSGIRKEKYMLDAPFNVGQFLKLADMLHKEYCIQVRSSKNKQQSSIPAQLIGNEMLAIASENPVEGLNRLRDRMKIYLAWAETVPIENAKLAKWILNRFAEVSLKIASSGELPQQFSPVQQAQVLLGYLANIPKEKDFLKKEKNIKEENPNE
jgi:hypothetical protein